MATEMQQRRKTEPKQSIRTAFNWQKCNWQLFCIKIKVKIPRISQFQLLRYEDLMPFCIRYDSKLNIFGFLTAGWTNKEQVAYKTYTIMMILH